MSSPPTFRVGLISDTHGLLRPEARDWLRGSHFIVHAGDIGDAGVIEELSKIAPVTAVRGNNDNDAWASHIPETNLVQVGEVSIYVLHAVQELDLDPVAAGIHIVVAGHSHRPACVTRDGVLFVNPGSAGPRRFNLPIAAGELIVSGKNVTPRLVELSASGTQVLQTAPY